MEEIWKDIKGYEGLYQVSNLGRVRSLDRTVSYCGRTRKFFGKILIEDDESIQSYQRYVSVDLCKNGGERHYLVHRLVADAFLPNPENKPTVNHINGHKHNNHLDNLEWATWSENNSHAFRIGLNTTDPNKSGATKVSNEVTSKPVYCVETDIMYKSISECARVLDIYSSSITRSLQRGGTTVKSKGKRYTFKEVNAYA